MPMHYVVSTVDFVFVEEAVVSTGGRRKVSPTRAPSPFRCFPEFRSPGRFAAEHSSFLSMCVTIRVGVCPSFASGRVHKFRVPPYCVHVPLSKLPVSRDFVRHRVPASDDVWGIFLLGVGFMSR